MSKAIAPFLDRYRAALANPQLGRNLLNFQRSWAVSRNAAIRQLAEDAPAVNAEAGTFEAARRRIIDAKNAVISSPSAHLESFIRRAGAAGAVVHRAETAAAARDIVLRILRGRDARLLAKGKSMVGEELFLNHFLEDHGFQVVETDLGEWIIQLLGETPSHMVMPAIHKNRAEVAALFTRQTGSVVSPEDIQAQVEVARQELRRKFLAADVGLIGANALIAESGTVMLITNEGNGDLVSTLPKTLIVLAGWEKLVPTFADATAQVRVLARSATGQEITTYTSFITGGEPEHEVHIVLVDNGRSAMLADPEFRDALRCIRCAACADVCPPFQVVGGQVFGHIYSGAIGLVNTSFHHGLGAAAGPQSLCVSCNACATVCPVEIPLPRQILTVRERAVAANGLPWPLKIGLGVWSKQTAFDVLSRAGRWLQQPLRRGQFLRLPLPAAWAWRSVPALAERPARDDLLGHTFPPVQGGPWASSNAAGKRVAYFIQCLTDRFAPEQAHAAVAVIRACGATVVVPRSQHCCGLPHLDAGTPEQARRLAQQTIECLEAADADFVVSAAASCVFAIKHDYPALFAGDPAWHGRATRLAGRTYDFISFVETIARPSPLPTSTNARSTFHGFCQSTNLLQRRAGGHTLSADSSGAESPGVALLRRAGVATVLLVESEVCCGFGGSTSMIRPEISRGIVGRKLDNVAATGAEILITDNPGCVLHLRGSADAAEARITVKHIAEIVADRLGKDAK